MELYINIPSWDAATQLNSLFLPCQLGLLVKYCERQKSATTQHFMITSLHHLRQINCVPVSHHGDLNQIMSLQGD